MGNLPINLVNIGNDCSDGDSDSEDEDSNDNEDKDDNGSQNATSSIQQHSDNTRTIDSGQRLFC